MNFIIITSYSLPSQCPGNLSLTFIFIHLMTDNICVAVWNIDGLFQRIYNQRSCKLDDVDVVKCLNKFDIIGLIETHCGPSENLNLDNYYIFQTHRKKSPKAVKYSGGIAIAIKENIRKGITILPITHSEYLWIILGKNFFNFVDDLYLCYVYICPSNSSFSGKTEDIFELLENDIAKFSSLGNCMILGDFNAKTNSELDYIDYYIPENVFSDTDNFSNQNDIVPLPRNNLDKHDVDSNGIKLLELCKTCYMRIANGRFLGDQLGYYNNPSVIDYLLINNNVFHLIETFHVHNLTPASIHCPISAEITCNRLRQSTKPKTTNNINSQQNELNFKFLWSYDLEDVYLQALSAPYNLNMLNSLTNLNPKTNVNTTLVDNAISELNHIILNAAEQAKIPRKTFRPTICNKSMKPNKNKQWFDQECRIVHRQIKNTANKIRKDPYNKSLMTELLYFRKRYKRIIQSKKRQYTNNIINNLNNLYNISPNHFWELARKLNYNSKSHDKLPTSITIDDWQNHFENLMGEPNNGTDQNSTAISDYIRSNKDKVFNSLNYKITKREVTEAIIKLKCNKAVGIDKIPNEFIKTGREVLLPAITNIFNLIFTHSIFPSIWNINTLTPIFKCGDKNNPANYRGIAVSCCLSKVFCSVLNKRLTSFLYSNKIIPDNQIGFKKGCRTSDHILVLKSLIEKYITKNKYLYTAFIDFKAAFDSIWREGLIYKLLKYDIGGTFLNMIINIYSDIRYRVKASNNYSKDFPSYAGVKQGCILSPALFNTFLSDLPEIFNKNCSPVKIHDIETSCLLYADDLVILSTTELGLQKALDKLYDYCTKWKLTLNVNKTKTIVFNKTGKLMKNINFFYSTSQIENVHSYKYLGIKITASGSFTAATNLLKDIKTM